MLVLIICLTDFFQLESPFSMMVAIGWDRNARFFKRRQQSGCLYSFADQCSKCRFKALNFQLQCKHSKRLHGQKPNFKCLK